MNEILMRQLALDFCCSPDEVLDGENHFTLYRPLPGRRTWQEDEKCALKIAAVNGKLLFTGREDLIGFCRETYQKHTSEWFFEPSEMRLLDGALQRFGQQIGFAHPFYICEKAACADTRGFETVFFEKDEIERCFKGDARFDEAFTFCPEAPDVLGVAALSNGKIVGMAGASADSPTMRQIGINVEPDFRNRGVARMLVSLISCEIIKRGSLPFYGTSFSHLSSQRVAIAAGFLPAWVELTTTNKEH